MVEGAVQDASRALVTPQRRCDGRRSGLAFDGVEEGPRTTRCRHPGHGAEGGWQLEERHPRRHPLARRHPRAHQHERNPGELRIQGVSVVQALPLSQVLSVVRSDRHDAATISPDPEELPQLVVHLCQVSVVEVGQELQPLWGDLQTARHVPVDARWALVGLVEVELGSPFTQEGAGPLRAAFRREGRRMRLGPLHGRDVPGHVGRQEVDEEEDRLVRAREQLRNPLQALIVGGLDDHVVEAPAQAELVAQEAVGRDQDGSIASLTELLGHRGQRRVHEAKPKPLDLDGRSVGRLDVVGAVAPGWFPGEEGGVHGPGPRRGHPGVLEHHASSGEAGEVGRGVPRVGRDAEAVGPDRVQHHHQDIGTFRLGGDS